jgi:GTP-binding protein
MDLPESQDNLALFKEQIGEDYPIIAISAYTHDNLNTLLYKIADILESSSYMPLYEEEQYLDVNLENERKMNEANFEINLSRDNVYEVSGDLVDRFFRQTNFDQYDSIARFSRRLRQIGVDKALRAKGVKDGDVVRIQSYEFEFMD